MKKFIYFSIPLALVAILAMAADIPHVNRSRNGIISTGGSSDYNGHTSVVTYDSPTNEYSTETVTATVAGSATASSNTFATAYLATPVAWRCYLSGASGTQITNVSLTGVTVTTSTIIVTGLSTNSVTGVNNLPVIVYGYKRAGVFE